MTLALKQRCEGLRVNPSVLVREQTREGAFGKSGLERRSGRGEPLTD